VRETGRYLRDMSDEALAAANDAMIREFLTAWERRDTEHIVDCFTDDGIYHSIPLTPIAGRAAIREFVSKFVDVPPGRLVVRNQIATDTIVMNERTDHITLNGRPVTLPICGIFEIEGGRIKAWREYFDLGPAAEAYGG
jgi:limonene-1,2-epoxide hydrolase